MEQYSNKITSNIPLQDTISRVEEAVQYEKEDALFYDYLISVAPTSEEREIINSIRRDERIHERIFKGIYANFTGMNVSIGAEETFIMPESYLEGIKKALSRELREVEYYRYIKKGLPGQVYRDMLSGIITDELNHVSKLNYLFKVNSMVNKRSIVE